MLCRRVLSLALVSLLSCGEPFRGPGVIVRLAAAPRPGAGCLDGGQPLPPTALIGQGGILRLSVVRRSASGESTFVCDAQARIPDQIPSLDLGPAGDPYDLYAEWFDPTGARAGQGVLPGLGPGEPIGGVLPLHLFRTSEWSCPPGALSTGRAFHSATALPSGEVLLLGGVAALPEQGPAIFQLLGGAEIFDPRTGRFFPVQEETGVVPRGRAFHHVALLDSGPGTVRLLVYGGVAAPQRRPALDGAPGSPTLLRFTPIGTTEAAGAELLTYDPAARRLSRKILAATEFPRIAFSGGTPLGNGGMLLVGGALFPVGREIEGVRSRLEPGDDAVLALPGAEAPRAGLLTLPRWLVAPSVTQIGPGAAIVIGAARSMPVEAPSVHLRALRIGGLDSKPRLDGDGEIQGAATVLHRAVRLQDVGGEAQILVSGGFLMEASEPIQARQPPPAAEAVRIYRVRPAGLNIDRFPVLPYGPQNACGSAMEHYRPAGFEAATATLSGRRALISGGTPTAQFAGCQDCEPGDTGTVKLLCVLRQASLYSQTTGKLEAAPPLGLGRMGHQQTLLPGGAVLVTGGLVRPGGDATPATSEAEIFVPRPRKTGVEDVDDPLAPLLGRAGLSRTDPDLARPCKTL